MTLRVLAAVAAGALWRQVAANGCHADLLVLGVDYSALTEQEKLAAGAAVAQKIAVETGLSSENVLSKLFAGNYNAQWSPVKNRPQANVFLASLLKQCQSPEMVLGAMRGPQLQEAVTQALASTLSQSSAVVGAIHIIGASVVPETSPGGSMAAMSGASSGEQAGAPVTPAQGGGGGGVGVVVIIFGAGLLLFALWVVPKLKKRTAGGNEETDDESQNFTGH
mmetsp:Transcript_26718/g.75021  ORF Transcript_26718/g.75021 Transcript_26718/m.75021 type:complete len:222 (+) Transcript_26718:3-668(+)